MTHQAPETELVAALRSSVAGKSMPMHVGHLRQQVEAALGSEDARRLRREVHQLMVAAEEHLPTRLIQVRPLTLATLARLSSELATTRSWSVPTAERTTRTWAAALGFEHLAELDWPPHVASLRPTASIDSLEVGQTAPPPAPAARVADAVWPTPSKRLAKNHPLASSGEPPLGIAQAYAGMPLAVYGGLLVALTVVLIVFLFLVPPALVIVLPILGFGLGTALTRAAGQGAVIATENGIEFVPYTGLLGRSAPEPQWVSRWSDISVQKGSVATVVVQGQSLQIGPLHSAFAEAAASRAGHR